MSSEAFSNLKSFVRSIIYLIVLIGYSVCNAGSYDDFFSAVRHDDARTVNGLLMRGFDPNTSSPHGESGLFLAVKESAFNVAGVLLAWPGTHAESRTPNDESPLMLAALNGLTDWCQKLIARGADVNKTGWTPLHYAATNGHVAAINVLLEEHAYIDAESPNGTTPLMMAARYGTPEAVKLLLEAGADAELRNVQGLSALDFARDGQRPDAQELIAAAVRLKQSESAR